MYRPLLFLTLIVTCALSSNILYISPVASPSHHIWNRALAFELVKKGHNLTLIGPNTDPETPKNYTHILFEGIYDGLAESFDMNAMGTYSVTRMMNEFTELCVFLCDRTIKTKGLQQLLDYPESFKFHLIIIDSSAGSCLYPLIHRFNYPPSIAVTPFLLPSYMSHNFGNHLYPSYVPWYNLPYTQNMPFMERLWNYIFSYLDIVLRKVKLRQVEYKLAQEIFGKDIPPMETLERHVSLLLTNTDPILDYPQPLPPNFIPVGGLHTRKSKPLPQDLQVVLDSAKNGVIVFSLGSNFRSDKLGHKALKELLRAFAQISETVVWKFESEIEDLPKNVIVRKWLPQNDLLGHPNVKLFIGHGGSLSTQEAIFHGVPMICVPFVSDQHINTKKIVNKKLGVYLDYKQISTNYVLKLLREVLDNPEYTKNMKSLSKIFRDRSETPLERGVFWIEYVLRHGGAQFLSTPARDLPFYKSSGWDVILFLSVLLYILLIIVYKSVLFIFRQLGGKKKIKVT